MILKRFNKRLQGVLGAETLINENLKSMQDS